jgi:hypothetical protein
MRFALRTGRLRVQNEPYENGSYQVLEAILLVGGARSIETTDHSPFVQRLDHGSSPTTAEGIYQP